MRNHQRSPNLETVYKITNQLFFQLEGHERQAKTEKGLRQHNSALNVGSWTGSWNQKRTLVGKLLQNPE